MLNLVVHLFCCIFRYVVLNRTGFRKICKKYDKLHPDKTSGSGWFVAKVETQPFARINFDAMLSAIGMVYQKFRRVQSSTNRYIRERSSVFLDARDIVRIEKFWLCAEESVWLKLLLTKHLDFIAPPSVHPKEREQAVMHPGIMLDSSRNPGANLEKSKFRLFADRKTQANNPLSISSRRTKIYFDNDKHVVYHSTLDRPHAPTGFHLGWGGTNAGGGEFKINAHTTMDYHSNPGHVQIKARQRHLQPLLSGELSEEQGEQLNPQMMDHLQGWLEEGLKPVLRCEYDEMLYTSPSHDLEVRISEDIRCYPCDNASPKDYRTAGIRKSTDSPMAGFPFIAVTVSRKGDSINTPPEWLSKLRNSPSIVSVNSFSKMAYGLASLKGRQVLERVPSWFDSCHWMPPNKPLFPDQEPPGNVPVVSLLNFTQSLSKVDEQNPFDIRPTLPGAVLPLSSSESRLTPRQQSMNMNVIEAIDRQDLQQGLLAERTPPPEFGTTLALCCQAFGHLVTSCWQMIFPPKAESHIDPKTYCANERTFLDWVSVAIPLYGLSGFLIHYGTTVAALTGFFLGSAGSFFIVWAYYMYSKRLTMIRNREPILYTDSVAPEILAYTLFIALSTAFLVSFGGEGNFQYVGHTPTRHDPGALDPTVVNVTQAMNITTTAFPLQFPTMVHETYTPYPLSVSEFIWDNVPYLITGLVFFLPYVYQRETCRQLKILKAE